ncbi:hypothetical protein [Streptomyces sp. B21-083]|uniref:hypothetical protein n=1 Tax=Streptomyces sp. B21-083 TaxID=3039410 RepID=UPI002FF2BFE5
MEPSVTGKMSQETEAREYAGQAGFSRLGSGLTTANELVLGWWWGVEDFRGARGSHLLSRFQVRGLPMRQQTGDGLHRVAHMLTAAEVAGQRLPVLEMCDAMLDPDAM